MSEYPPAGDIPRGVPAAAAPASAAREWSLEGEGDLVVEPAGDGRMLTDDQFLLAYLREHDAACPACGYNLRMLGAPRCPECGRGLRLGLSLAFPPLAGWLAVAIPVLLSAGVGLLLALMLAAHGELPTERGAFMAATTYFWLTIPGAALVVVLRRPIMRAGAAVKAALSVTAAVLAVAAMVLLLKRF